MLKKESYERRLTFRLMQQWESLAKAIHLPRIESFSPEIVHDLWANCMQLKILSSNGKFSYTYEYMGKDLIKAYGRDLTGKSVAADIRTLPGAGVLFKLNEKMPNVRQPLMEQGNFINEDNQLIKYRSCILPFSDDDSVSHTIIGLSWKMFSQA